MRGDKSVFQVDFFFLRWSHCVALADLDLTLWTKLASNSQGSSWLCLLSAGIKSLCHYALLFIIIIKI